LSERAGFCSRLAKQAVLVCHRRPRPRRLTCASGGGGSADERHLNHALVQPRGDVVSTLRGGLIHPQSGPRRPVSHKRATIWPNPVVWRIRCWGPLLETDC
jgi:hypothetical protein